jgi:hypothetical protein
MKKLMVVLVMVFVMYSPEPSYAQSQKPVDVWPKIMHVRLELMEAAKELQDVGNDLRVMRNTTPKWAQLSAVLTLEQAWWVFNASQLLFPWYWCTKAECNLEWRVWLVRMLQLAKKELTDTVMIRLQETYVVLEPQAASDKVVRSQTIIRSTLPLYDIAIQLLEQQPADGAQ